MPTEQIEKKLTEAGYQKLFSYGERSLADSIWDNGKNQAALEGIVENSSSSLHGRFLAAEMLRRFKVEIPHKSYKTIAEAYVYALKHTPAGQDNIGLIGNQWGFLYELNDSGDLGQQLLRFGEVAVPYLKELLDDSREIQYEGSKDATVGNAYQYRVKDFAAFYISKIRNIPVKFYQDLKERDKEVERLKDVLNK